MLNPSLPSPDHSLKTRRHISDHRVGMTGNNREKVDVIICYSARYWRLHLGRRSVYFHAVGPEQSRAIPQDRQMSLPEERRPVAVRRENVNVFDRDAEQ